MENLMKLTKILALGLLGSAVASLANATAVAPLSGFTTFADMENTIIQAPTKSYKCVGTVGNGCKNQPQAFDAEKLSFKRDGNMLYIALKTGFNLATGYYKDTRTSTTPHVYAGDLALSFKTKAGSKPLNSYDYAVDFGFETRNWTAAREAVHKKKHKQPFKRQWESSAVEMDNNGDAKDAAGVYKVTKWDNNTSFSTPVFAAQEGSFFESLQYNKLFKEGQSFIRVIGFDLTKFGYTAQDQVSFTAFWTMSCGNDTIWGDATAEGTSEVPVPAAAWLFGTALLGLAGVKRKA